MSVATASRRRAGPAFPAPAPRKLKPVKWWAAIGVASLGSWAYTWSRWLLSGNAEPTRTGPTPIPEWMRLSLRLNEFAITVAFAAGLWFFVIRPWRRRGGLQTDGMLFIGFVAMYWQDPLASMFRPWSVYNTGLHQWGSWANFIPGFNAPNGHLFSEPLVAVAAYPLIMLMPVCWACAVMRRARDRWPSIGNAGLIGVAFAFLLVVDLVLELTWLHTGFYIYPAAIKELTLFYGRYYQFPVYEAGIFTAFWVLCVALRWFKNDKGETVAERGIDDVRATPRQKTGLRLLALIGVINVTFFFSYNLPTALTTLYADDWPKDVVERTYFSNNFCPPDVGYSCPSRRERIPTRSSDQRVKPR